MRWKNQEYDGEWKNGQPHGLGSITWVDDKGDRKFMKNRYSDKKQVFGSMGKWAPSRTWSFLLREWKQVRRTMAQ